MDYNEEEAGRLKSQLNRYSSALDETITKASSCMSAFDDLHEETKEFYQNDDDLSNIPKQWTDKLSDIITNLDNGMKGLSNEDTTAGTNYNEAVDNVVAFGSTLLGGIASAVTGAKTDIIEALGTFKPTGEASNVDSVQVETLTTDGNSETIGESSTTGDAIIENVNDDEDKKSYNIDSSEDKESEKVYIVNTKNSNLNVRSETGEIIESIPKGSNVKVVGQPDSKGYVKVEYGDGKTGYVSQSYLKPKNDSEQIISDAVDIKNNDTNLSTKLTNDSSMQLKATGVVKTQNSNLNLRTEPNGDVIGTLPKGSEVNIIGESDDGKWYKILYNDKEMFVSKKYVGDVKE